MLEGVVGATGGKHLRLHALFRNTFETHNVPGCLWKPQKV
jgi:hypothetical protein